MLVHLNNAGTMYTRQQAAFNHFLMTALAIVFLAVCHAPSDFGQQCRPAFDSAIKLVRTSAAHGSNSRRLWKSISGLLPQTQDLYANPSSVDDRGDAQATSIPRTLSHPSSSQIQTLEGTQNLSNCSQTSYGLHMPHESVGSLHDAPSLDPDPSGLGPYNTADAWGMSALDVPPMQDITQITDHLTGLYEFFETSTVDDHHFNFLSSSEDHLLNDTELMRLFQEQIAGI